MAVGDPNTQSRIAVPAMAPASSLVVKVFAEDGSVFVDGDYLIRGVAGRSSRRRFRLDVSVPVRLDVVE